MVRLRYERCGRKRESLKAITPLGSDGIRQRLVRASEKQITGGIKLKKPNPVTKTGYGSEFQTEFE
jgi:hypothetical protein